MAPTVAVRSGEASACGDGGPFASEIECAAGGAAGGPLRVLEATTETPGRCFVSAAINSAGLRSDSPAGMIAGESLCFIGLAHDALEVGVRRLLVVGEIADCPVCECVLIALSLRSDLEFSVLSVRDAGSAGSRK